MAFFFSKRKLRMGEVEFGELNIVPYLDILMNLIIFMLLSMTGLALFGILNVNAPNYGGAEVAAPDANAPKLLLSVLISEKGFFVAGTGAVLGQQAEGQAPSSSTEGAPTIPRKSDGSLDFAALNAKMIEVKAAFPSETKVIIGAEGNIPYESLIQTMDAIRETFGKERKLLFSDVTLAAM
jgi:biopolymer transport protein ExbD